MRARLLTLVMLAACDERGQILLTDDLVTDTADTLPDPTKPPVTDEDAEDTEAEVPDTEEPLTPPAPTDCGPAPSVPAAFLGAPSRVFVGEATLRRTSAIAPWTWSGCEVERWFDATGAWACDIVRTPKGEGREQIFGDPKIPFDLVLTVRGADTTCTQAIDLVLRYGVTSKLPLERKAELSRTQGDQPWTRIGTFAANGGANLVRFDYQTAFTN